jgi:hypothetical protein
MAIEKAINQFGIEFPVAYNKVVWINLNGHSGTFSAEVTVKTWKDKAARDAAAEPIKTENTVLSLTQEEIDAIRTIVYGAASRDDKYKDGKKV